jgi:hypothetical protein
MAFAKIRAAAPRAGKLKPVVLDMLPGKPVVHLEQLGDDNATWVADQISRANSKTALGIGSRKASKKLLREIVERKREVVTAHAVRKIEAVHDDGHEATADDIPEFCESLPGYVVEAIYDYAANANNWLEVEPESDVAEVAGK